MKNKQKNQNSSMGAGIAIGAGVGAAIGVAIENLAVGVAVGIALGAAIFMSKSFEVFGPGGMIMPIMVIVIAAYLVYLARQAKDKGWLS